MPSARHRAAHQAGCLVLSPSHTQDGPCAALSVDGHTEAPRAYFRGDQRVMTLPLWPPAQ